MTLLFNIVLPVAAAWVGLTLGYGGLGLAVRRLFGLRIRTAQDVLTAPWIGWAAGIAFLQLWHLAFPVDGRALAAVSGAGLLGLAWCGRDLVAWIRQRQKAAVLFAGLVAAAAVWLAFQTTRQPGNYDSGLYHINAVRWNFAHAIVPGLGNLHDRFAFNSSFFLYAAMLNAGRFADTYHHLASGLLLLWALAKSLKGAVSVLSPGRSAAAHDVFDALFLAPLVALGMNPEYGSSPTPDTAVFALGFVMASELLGLLGWGGDLSPGCVQNSGAEPQSAQKETIRPEGRAVTPLTAADGDGPSALLRAGASSLPGGTTVQCHKEIQYSWFLIGVLAVAGVTVKMSLAAVGGAALVLAFMHARPTSFAYAGAPDGSARGFALPQIGRMCLWMGLVLLLLAVPWMIRGVILSGWAAYPAGIGHFNVDWQMPVESAQKMSDVIKGFARLPGPEWPTALHGWGWVGPWLIRISENSDVVLPIGIFLAGLGMLLVDRAAWRDRTLVRRLSFVLVPLAGIAFCLVTAPNPKFAGASFWMLGFGLVALAVARLDRRSLQAVFLAIVLVVLAAKINAIDFVHVWNRDAGPIRKAATQARVTESGLTVFVPAQAGSDQCWDAPLPCTPYFNPKLSLREPGDLGKGFRLGGETQ